MEASGAAGSEAALFGCSGSDELGLVALQVRAKDPMRRGRANEAGMTRVCLEWLATRILRSPAPSYCRTAYITAFDYKRCDRHALLPFRSLSGVM